MVVLSLAPIVSNAVMLLVIFVPTFFIGPIFGKTVDGLAPLTSSLLHLWSGLSLLCVILACWVLGDWTFSKALIGLLCFFMVHRLFIRTITVSLPREVNSNASNLAWWDGRWYRLGIRSIWAPVREYFCKGEIHSIY